MCLWLRCNCWRYFTKQSVSSTNLLDSLHLSLACTTHDWLILFSATSNKVLAGWLCPEELRGSSHIFPFQISHTLRYLFQVFGAWTMVTVHSGKTMLARNISHKKTSFLKRLCTQKSISVAVKLFPLIDSRVCWRTSQEVTACYLEQLLQYVSLWPSKDWNIILS